MEKGYKKLLVWQKADELAWQVYAETKKFPKDESYGITSQLRRAVLSIPIMKWGVGVLGAISGGILTSGAWLAMGMPEQYIWAGGLVGFIGGGLISFVVFKAAVILFTSLGGSSLMIVGALAVIYRNMTGGAKVEELVLQHKWFLPVILLGPMIIGMLLQYKFSKDVKDLMA